MIQSYLKRLTRSELFAVMTGGFTSVAGSTLVGYTLLGALPYLLAATVMNAPASLDRGDRGVSADRVHRADRHGQRAPERNRGVVRLRRAHHPKGARWVFSPVAWLIGVPWDEAAQAGTYIGEKTVLNEFVAYADFGPNVKNLSHQTVVVVTFALAGFANFASIAIQIGSIGGLAPERRGDVAQLGLKALLAGSLVNLANAAIAGVVAT